MFYCIPDQSLLFIKTMFSFISLAFIYLHYSSLGYNLVQRRVVVSLQETSLDRLCHLYLRSESGIQSPSRIQYWLTFTQCLQCIPSCNIFSSHSQSPTSFVSSPRAVLLYSFTSEASHSRWNHFTVARPCCFGETAAQMSLLTGVVKNFNTYQVCKTFKAVCLKP